VIATTLPFGQDTIRVISAYCPNGQALDSDKYVYKLAWFKAFAAWLKQEKQTHRNIAVLGDYNVAPKDEDVHNPEKWIGQILVSEPERAALAELVDLGFTDAFRLFEQPAKSFSWWDYRLNSFKRNAGVRIDHVLLSESLVPQCKSCVIDKGPRGNEQPSDHTPVIATLSV
jgi:exodeoxyribonuclease III